MANYLGRYEILDELGRGAMGVVYKARDPVLSRIVAIKTMPTDSADDDELRRRLEREAAAAARLKHPNIITVHDYGEEDGVPFIAMEFLEGIDLKQILRRKITLYPSEKIGILRQMALGLGHAHKAGVVHRDIKPANIRILKDGTVKIMDFGIARLASSQLTRVGTVLGSVDYMSPEQVEGKQVDNRCDVFCYGVVAYEMLTNRVPFKGPNMPATMKNILDANMPPIESEYLEAFPQMDGLIRRCLQREPEDRFENFQDLVRTLDVIRMAITAESTQTANAASVSGDESGSAPDQETVVIPGGSATSTDGSASWQGGDQTVSSAQLWVNRDRFQNIHSVIAKDQPQRTRSTRSAPRSLPGRTSQARGAPTSKRTIPPKSEEPRESWKLYAVVAPVVVLAVVVSVFVLGGFGGGSEQTSVSDFVERQLVASAEKADLGNLRGAIADLERILEVTPDHAEASTRMATLTQQLDSQFDEAISTARGAIEQQDFGGAITALEAALLLKPDDDVARDLLNSARSGASTAETKERFDELLAEGRAHLEAGRFDEAIATLQAASALRPSNPEANQLLTEARRQASNKNDAEAAYRSGLQAFDRGNYAEAVRQFERCLSLDPSHRQARQRLADARQEAARPRYGQLTINALPFGEAFLDGESLGTTPVRLEQVTVGSHEVRITKNGYQTYTSSVEIQEGQVTNVVAQLQPNP